MKKQSDFILSEYNTQKAKVYGDVANLMATSLASVNPAFALVPVFSYAINWAIGLASPEYIKKRLIRFNEELIRKKITEDEFKDKVASLSEHNEYVLLTHLRNMLITCIPESLDVYIGLIIDFTVKNEYDEKEELCEIISLLNKNDIELLRIIKEFIEHGEKNNYKKNRQKSDQKGAINDGYDDILEEFKDRDIYINEQYTIFWEDFKKYFELDTEEMGQLLLEQYDSSTNKKWPYITRAFLKMQNIGVLEIDYYTTIGNINSLNANRFHITLYGRKLLEYI